MTPQAKELVNRLIAGFPPEKATGIGAEIQMNLTGEGGGDWVVKIGDGKVTASEGQSASPRLTVTTSLADLVDITDGKLDATAAFMQGKIKLGGDVGLAMRMVSLLQRS